MVWSDFDESSWSFTVAPAESARFGVSVSNLTVGTDVTDRDRIAIMEALKFANGIVVLRYPSSEDWLATELSKSNLKMLPTDTLVYWENKRTWPELQNPRISLKQCKFDEDLEKAICVVRNSFKNYRTHWSQDPRTEHFDMAVGYEEWVNHLFQKSDSILQYAEQDGEPVGMMAMSFNNQKYEVLLAGVIKDVQGAGIYGEMFQTAMNQISLGLEIECTISTQVSNIRVQRSWINLGLKPAKSINVFHVVGGAK